MDSILLDNARVRQFMVYNMKRSSHRRVHSGGRGRGRGGITPTNDALMISRRPMSRGDHLLGPALLNWTPYPLIDLMAQFSSIFISLRSYITILGKQCLLNPPICTVVIIKFLLLLKMTYRNGNNIVNPLS